MNKIASPHYSDGQTVLSQDEKQGLIPALITRAELNAFEMENILEARKWLMQKTILARQDIFTQEFLLKLHQRMYGKVWRWAGAYRKSDKNIGLAHYDLPVAVHQLLGNARYWLKHSAYSIVDLAIIFHHRLVEVHLFSDGNGRHARLCADAIVLKYNAKKLTWGGRELAQPNKVGQRYIAALRQADARNYGPLLDFCK